ncbi:MAG: hypothetical protein V5A31_13955 [Haloferacaceae archaeon]
MTVLRLLSLRTPPDFAAWARLGGEYVTTVTRAMGFDAPADLEDRLDRGVAALREDERAVPAVVARPLVATLLADAAFPAPFCEYTPVWYELALAGANAVATRRLRAVAGRYAAGLDGVDAPRFPRPRDLLVDGDPATRGVSGFSDRFLLADAVLHVDWYVHVARAAGVAVPADLVARTRRESVRYYRARRDPSVLSPDVRRFQHALFADDAWVRGLDAAYGLDSALLGVWERLLRGERARLAP